MNWIKLKVYKYYLIILRIFNLDKEARDNIPDEYRCPRCDTKPLATLWIYMICWKCRYHYMLTENKETGKYEASEIIQGQDAARRIFRGHKRRGNVFD